jgi:hypothetical protein
VKEVFVAAGRGMTLRIVVVYLVEADSQPCSGSTGS